MRICKSCHVEHVENCPNCYGFGLRKGTDSPISAHHSKYHAYQIEWDECSVCHGTPFGIRKQKGASNETQD